MSNSRFGKFLSSKGFYIALAVCVVGAGAAAWVAIDATMNSIAEQDAEKLREDPAPIASEEPETNESKWDFSSLREAERKVDDVRVKSSSSEAPKEKASSEKAVEKETKPELPAGSETPAEDVMTEQEEEAVWGKKKEEPVEPLAWSLPILNEVFNPYSAGELVKNKTLNDWRTHDGIDIKAAKGTEVMACADGKVSSIYDDALWGTCMEIEHSGGTVSVYCGLSRDSITLKEGDEVKIKDVIAKVDSIPCEISLESHLHFGMKQDGKWVDPVKAMDLAA